jgi:alcohol dehydrogenase class IV
MQKVIRGAGSFKNVADKVVAAGNKSVLLVTGKHFDLSMYPFLSKSLELNHFVKQGVNVTTEEVEALNSFYNKHQSGAIMAVGGGTVMDICKALIFELKNTAVPPYHVAIPTTAGSGSEATSFAVLYKGKKKFSLADPLLLPQLVVLDPELTYSLSPYQTAVSGMDVFAQAVESFWNIHANETSRTFAAEAINLWKLHFLDAVTAPSPRNREGMLEASHLAGAAINITRTTGPHALSYYLTSNYQVPHGHAVALLLQAFFMYNSITPELYKILEVQNADKAIAFTREIMQKAGLRTTLSDLGINKESIMDEWLEDINAERFANNPVPLDREKLKNVLLKHL